ncbi:SIR2 family NAD-dependent protein deacylase [Hymenobacter terrenus]|uniref:SIR2 family NAD-dependent protein deacylase n=1 Tax=Hymenobacter terrenus TaxID=1629124 RepID=UPI000B134DE0|nr:SIR2 family protein [Hymenobacter terrenus]
MEESEQLERLVGTFRGLDIELYESNAEFNEWFDEQYEEFPIVGDKPYAPSKILFWLDRPLYKTAIQEFEGDALSGKYEEAIDILKENNQLGRFKEVANAVRRQRLVPFVGAGLSKPMNMPLWGEALKALAGEMPTFNNSDFTRALSEGRLLDAAQLLYEFSPDQTTDYIHRTYSVDVMAGPIQLLPRISYGCVVTTNFDQALEKIFSQHKMPFEGYMNGNQSGPFMQKLVKGDRCLLKLHGDFENPDTYVFTFKQYEEGYGQPFDYNKHLPKALRQIYVSNSLLFLGCSLDNDWTMQLFQNVAETSSYQIPDHYAILPAPENPDDKHAKTNQLLRCHIRPIWYPPGRHDLVEKFIEMLTAQAKNRFLP